MTLPRLIFITGKGGTGKSTLSAALALALSRRRPTVLADLDQRRSAARILKADPDGAPAKRIARNLDVMALSPRGELEAFIERIVPLKMISRRMLKSRTFGYVTAALPGLEAFLMLERLRALAGEAALKDRYVVVDAPATGTALELLSVAEGVKGIAPSGTLNRLAAEVESFLSDPNRFGVVLTLTPEEMALREALEAAAALAGGLKVHRIAAILSAVPETLFEVEDLAALAALKEHARLAARRVEASSSASRARTELGKAGLHVVETPMVFAALAEEHLREMSRKLEAGLFDR